MVKLIVVAGSSSQKLADFFEKRGTFEIVAVYDNLMNNVNQIQNKVIIADKLLYLYNDNEEFSMNVKGDMQILSNLLTKDSFFKPGEIVFMTTSSPLAKQATKFFVTIMEDCNKTDYSIKTVEDKMSFVAIYNLLMGTTNTSDFKNKYTTLYKVERNMEENLEFSPQDDRDLLVEPFNMDSVSTYQNKQRAAKKAETGTIYTDNANTELSKDNSVQFEPIKLNNITDVTKYVIVSGLTKSGKSVWASQLAVSAAKNDLAVCLMDFTRNGDVLDLLSKSSVVTEESSMLAVLRQQESSQSLIYVSPNNNAEEAVIPEFIELFANQSRAGQVPSIFDVVIVVCEINRLESIRKLIISDTDVVLTTNAVISDINNTLGYMPMFDDKTTSTLILNNVVALNDDFISAEDVREMLPKTVRLVKNKRFTNFDTKGQLWKALFGDNA